MAKITCKRYHDISAGHRVYGHESKCAHLHGHNYRIHFTCEADQLDSVGRVVDFSKIKTILCQWLEDNWDHRFLVWEKDPIFAHLVNVDPTVVRVPFNPTAENMARHLLEVVSPVLLEGEDFYVAEITIEETAKCSATCSF